MHFNEPLPIAIDREVTIDMDCLFLSTLHNGDNPVILTTDGTSVTFLFNNFSCNTGLPRNTLQIPLDITCKEFFAKVDSTAYLPEVEVFVDLLLKGDDLSVTIQSHWLTVHDAKYKVNA